MREPRSFDDAIALLGRYQRRGWRLGLDRMQRLVADAALAPYVSGEERPRFIHVAGTNGKGSVCAYAQAMLCAAGEPVGGYFSPYVYSVRERVQFGCSPISEADLAEGVWGLLPVAEALEATELGGPTEFEFKTLLAFDHWRRKRAKWVALEVGLGGRLDATNVVAPAVSVIASIGRDHTAILGNTLAEIAGEKAGIIKPGVPVVAGPMPREALDAVRSVASRLGCELVEAPAVADWNQPSPPYGAQNAEIARLALGFGGFEIEYDDAQEVAKRVSIPGRFELRQIEGRNVLLDGAHNAEAASSLARAIERHFPDREITLLTARLRGHDHAAFYDALELRFGRRIVTQVDFFRAESAKKVAAEIEGATAVPALEHAWNEAIRATTGLLLVTGSFYLLGDLSRAGLLSSGTCSPARLP